MSEPSRSQRKLSVEEELAVRLAAIGATRRADSERIRRLAQRADTTKLISWLEQQRLLPLLGSRLHDIAGDLTKPAFRAAVEGGLASSRARFTLADYQARNIAQRLESAGIEAVAIKGPLLADRVYSDPGLRAPSTDLDFLLRSEQLGDAVKSLRQMGYRVFDDTIWADELPHYHYRLIHPDAVRPDIELHWRVHWYEKEYTDHLIRRSRVDARGTRIAAPADDIALLLIIFARDGFLGLRFATDIGAWWDACGSELSPAALDAVIDENPRLREPLLAGVRAADLILGLPRHQLVSEEIQPSRRASAALALINWRALGTPRQIATDVTLIDLLLTPRGAYRVYLRHYYFQPLLTYSQQYGWSSGSRWRNEFRRTLHVIARITKNAWRYGRRLRAIRRGFRLDLLPARDPS